MGAQRSLITRRRLIELGALSALPAVFGCRKRDQASVLSGLVTEVVLGMARDVRAESQTLQARVRALSGEPSLERQRGAQSAFKRAILAWKRAFAFRSGPFVSSDAFQRAAFWPVRPTLIAGVLGEQGPIDERRVQQLGVDARGLYTLEYLLFEDANARAMLLSDHAQGDRVRAYALELSVNILGYAERFERLLGDGQAFAASFAKGGKLSVDTLLSQTLDTLTIASGKFSRVERARSENRPLPFAVEGYFSSSSLEVVEAIISGSKSLYVGGGKGGLSELAAAASKPIDDHVRAAFRETEERLRAVGMPIEVALDSQPARFKSAAAAVAELRHVIDVELVSALSS
ncbi:MAG TPA: imelysin family protein [Polyangiaceae bacterium]|nr:imelysin family protein [Polyangiaceae bacterium]